MSPLTAEVAGWLPAVIFPAGALLQLLKVLPSKSVGGVSAGSWMLFGIANLGLYIYVEKYASLQSILGFLLTAVLDFAIVVLVLIRKPPTGRPVPTASR